MNILETVKKYESELRTLYARGWPFSKIAHEGEKYYKTIIPTAYFHLVEPPIGHTLPPRPVDFPPERSPGAETTFKLNGTGIRVFEAQTLYSIIRENGYSKILEIGTAKGFSCLYIIKALEDSGHPAIIHTLDINDARLDVQNMLQMKAGFDFNNLTKERFESFDKLEGLIPETITLDIIKEDSTTFVPNSEYEYDFCLIDGSHKYEICKQDFLNVFPKIKKGGCIAMDDIQKANVDDTPYQLFKEIVNGDIVNLDEIEIHMINREIMYFFGYLSDKQDCNQKINKWSNKDWVSNSADPAEMMCVIFKK